MKPYWITYALCLGIIIFQALEDGLRERKLKTLSKASEIGYIALFFLLMGIIPQSIENALQTLVLYLTIRAYLFDPVMHLTASYPVNYVGVTSPGWDHLMKRLKGWQFWVFRVFFLGFSLFWYYKVILEK